MAVAINDHSCKAISIFGCWKHRSSEPTSIDTAVPGRCVSGIGIMNYPPILGQGSDGGVEEKKEDEPVTLSPDHLPHLHGLHHQYSSGLFPPNGAAAASESMNHSHRNQPNGFQAKIQKVIQAIVDSCDSVVTFLVRGGEGGCQWPGTEGAAVSPSRRRPTAAAAAAFAKPPLSITEELRKLAESEGRVFGGGMRRADIPRFLGEEAVYSFDDDNISAISQHTLEEMTRHGIKHPVRRKLSSESSQSTLSLQQQQHATATPLLQVERRMLVDEERDGIV